MDRLTEATDRSLIFEEGDDAVLDAARVVLVDVVGREVMHEMRTHLFARLDRGLNVPIGRQGGRVFRRVAGRDAVQQAVIEDAELAKAADVIALDACSGQRLDLGVDAVHLGSGERRASQGAQVIEQGTSVALELAAEDVPHRQVGDVLEDHSAKAHLPGVERRGGADVLGGVHRVRDVVG